MDEASFNRWTAAAASAADATFQQLSKMDHKGVGEIAKVDKNVAAGSNSLDATFFQAMIELRHLDADFLKAARQ